MSNRPTISVIIPTYQPKEYLEECLKSALNQNCEEILYEIVLILNGPRQPYESTVKNLVQNIRGEKRIKFFYTHEKGVSNARNFGIENSKGDYLIFLDDDDLISENYLKNTFAVSNERSIVISNVKTFKSDLNHLGNNYQSKAFEKIRVNGGKSAFKHRKFLSNACSKLIPKKVIGRSRFNPKFVLGEDALFMAIISKNIKYYNKTSAETMYFVRKRPSSASRQNRNLTYELKNGLKQIVAYIKIYFQDPFKNDLLFFASRIAAVGKNFSIRLRNKSF